VTPENDPPVAYRQVFEIIEGSTLSGNLLGHDLDGDALTYRLSGDYTGSGTLTVNPDGSFTLTGAEAGTYAFSFIVSDGNLDSPPASVTIHVYGTGGGPGEWPVSGYGDRTILEDSSTEYIITVTGLTNPSLTATSSNTALLDNTSDGIQVENRGDGKFSLKLKPTLHQTGKTVITLEVKEGDTLHFVRTFVLTVTRDQHQPEAHGKTLEIDAGTYLYDFVTASDPNGDMLSFSVQKGGGPAHGTLEVFEEDGTFKYVPHPGFDGRDTFTFTVSDGECSETGRVEITVRAVARPPVAQSGSFSTNEDMPYSGTLTADKTEGGTLTYMLSPMGLWEP